MNKRSPTLITYKMGCLNFCLILELGDLELIVTGEYCDYDFDTVEIEAIEQPVPQTVIDAFNRHVWFSQYCLAEMYALKLPVAD